MMVTVIAVYFLILVGGIVRSTGAGMGCPDWPKCFGQWVPPTSESQLPPDYKAVYAEHRAEKNIRFSKYLNFLGYPHLADQVVNDPMVQEEGQFNVRKTWTEYVNRLVGVTIGLLMFLCLIGGIYYLQRYRRIFWISLLAFILVGFQGWIGSIVVSTNLLPWMITVHMLLALIIVGLLLLNYHYISKMGKVEPFEGKKLITGVLVFSILFAFIQIIVGTEVREQIDMVARQFGYAQRGEWVAQLNGIFSFHRYNSFLLLLSQAALFYLCLKFVPEQKGLRNLSASMLVLVLLSMISGILMANIGIPPYLQPFHLLVGSLIFGLQFYMLLKLTVSKKISFSYQ